MAARKQIGVRVDPHVFEAIEARRDDFTSADGQRADRSEVLRGMLDEAKVMFDPKVIAALQAFAKRNGLSMTDAWARVVQRGLLDEPDGGEA